LKGILPAAKDFWPQATFHFRNFGKGPAIIENVVIFLCTVKEEEFPEPRDLSALTPIPDVHLQFPPIIPAGSEWVLFSHPLDSAKIGFDYRGMKNFTKTMIVYGRVLYYSVQLPQEVKAKVAPYETGFFWSFLPPRTVNPRSKRRITRDTSFDPEGGEERNYYT
jgi:hypothetical protein